MTLERSTILRIGMSVLSAALVASTPAGASAVTTASPPSAAEERPDPLGRGLVVRVADDVPDAEVIRAWIEQRGQEVLGERVASLESRELIRVAVRGGPYDYRITLQVRRRGKDLPEQPKPLICECSSEEMLVRVGDAIDVAADQLAVAAARERAAEQDARRATERREAQRRGEAAMSETEGTRAVVRTRGREGTAARGDRHRSGPLGVAGIALLSTGAALLVGGIGIAAADGSDGRWSPGGGAMIGIGAQTWVGGLTMLIVDVARCRRVPSRCQSPRGGAGRSVAATGESGSSFSRRW